MRRSTRGNSGGPLVNIRGEVIVIKNAIASQTGYFAGYGFAIPITLARDVMEDLIEHGRVRRAVIGVQIREVNADDAGVAGVGEIRGAVVGSFTGEGGPAERAGLQPNDVIVAIDGQEVDRVSTLQRLVRSKEPGETIAVDVMRYGDRRSFRVRLRGAATRGRERAARPPRTRRRGDLAEKPASRAAVAPTSCAPATAVAPSGVLVARSRRTSAREARAGRT